MSDIDMSFYKNRDISMIKVYKHKNSLKTMKEKQINGDFLSDINLSEKLCTVFGYDWYASKKRPGYYYCLVPEYQSSNWDIINNNQRPDDINDMLSTSWQMIAQARYEYLMHGIKIAGLI